MRKSKFNEISARFEKYLFEMNRAQTTKEIAEGLGIKTSFAYTTLQLMEVFGTVQRMKRRGRHYYFLKGIYSDEQISALLPPKKVKPQPRRRSILSRPKRSSQERFLEKHISALRAQASSSEGPSALAMIGLTQPEMIEEEILTERLPIEHEVDIEIQEKFKTPITNKPFATVQYLSKDVRRLTQGQTKQLKEQLENLEGYQDIKDLGTIFAKLSALEYGRYGNVFYFSNGTNPWDYVRKVTIDPSISDLMVSPSIDVNRWSSWNDFLRGLKEPRISYGKDQYDKILDQFIETDHKLVEITVEHRKANYVNTILNKRIGERGLEEQVKASYVTDWVYLEKVE